jgi:phospholipase C
MRRRLLEISGRRLLRYRRDEPGGRPDPSLPAGHDRVPRIHHIVLLMMENHSFDNYLGTLGRGDGFPSPPPENVDRHGSLVRPHRLLATEQPEGVPSQSWEASHLQYGSLPGPARPWVGPAKRV